MVDRCAKRFTVHSLILVSYIYCALSIWASENSHGERMRYIPCSELFCALCCYQAVLAFVPPVPGTLTRQPTVPLHASFTGDDLRSQDFLMTEEEINPIIRIGKGEKQKIINMHGLWCVAVTIITCPIWATAMSLVSIMHQTNPDFDVDRALYDKTGKIWSRTWLRMTDSYPTISGNLDQLKEGQGPCLYVANHASWLDIPIICTVLDPVFKFIAKAELEKLPCIGQQLTGGDHILIDRDDRRSQLKTFKDGIGWLKRGVPIMAFPEGKRSPDGRLMDFKGGLFSMAVKTKVPIVPITIGHANAIMPANSLFPVQTGRDKLRIHIHEPIDTEGKSDEELVQLVRSAFLSTLPYNQHPASETPEASITVRLVSNESLHQSTTVLHVQPSAGRAHQPTGVNSGHQHVTSVPFFIVKEEEDKELEVV